MSKQHSTSTFIVVAASLAIVAATAFYVKENYPVSSERDDDDKSLGELSSDPVLNDAFRKAVAKAPSVLEGASAGDRLALYALYKQATKGDLPEDETAPSRIFVEKYYKFVARSKLRGMPRELAMKNYVGGLEMVLQQEGDANDEDLTGGMGAPRVSTMVNEDESDSDDKEEESLEQALRAAVSSCKSSDEKKNAEAINKVESLLRQGADANAADESGQTPLHFAADRGSLECLRLLLDIGVNVNAADEEGISVLQAAVIGGNIQAVKLLLEAGADPDQEDMDGDTPRSCAQDDGSKAMTQLFSSVKAQ